MKLKLARVEKNFTQQELADQVRVIEQPHMDHYFDRPLFRIARARWRLSGLNRTALDVHN